MQQQPRGVKWHSCSARKASPFRDVGELIGVSHQRVSQILAS